MTPRATPTMRKLTPQILGVAVLLQTLDATSIAVALPAIAADLQSDMLAVSAPISAYLLGSAVAVAPSGWLADRFGGRNVFLASILLFLLASVACAMATTLEFLTTARFVEGCAGAMLLPVGRMIIMGTYTGPERIHAYTTFVLPALLGPMIGPLLGGLIVEYATWHWIFLINLPLGLVSMLALYRLVENVRVESPRPLDLTGMLLICLALLILFSGMIDVSRAAWLRGWLMVSIGLLLCMTALLHARGREHALLQLPLFQVAPFRQALCVDLAWRMLINATPYLLSLQLQSTLGLSPSLTGMLILLIAFGSLLTKPITYRLVYSIGMRATLAIGTVGGAASFIACAWLSSVTPTLLIAGLLLAFGFFRSLVLSITSVKMFESIPPADNGAATTLSAIGQQSFQVIGLTSLTALMQVLGPERLGFSAVSAAIVGGGLLVLSSLYFIVRLQATTRT